VKQKPSGEANHEYPHLNL